MVRAFRSSMLRPMGSFLHGLWVVGLLVALWGAFLLAITKGFGHPSLQKSALHLVAEPEFWSIAGLISGIGLWTMIYNLGATWGRYRAWGTELEVRHGVLWQKTEFLPYVDIRDIRILQGPLMRLLGTADLYIAGARQAVRLCGVRQGFELRQFLLDRRESLRGLEADRSRALTDIPGR